MVPLDNFEVREIICELDEHSPDQSSRQLALPTSNNFSASRELSEGESIAHGSSKQVQIDL